MLNCCTRGTTERIQGGIHRLTMELDLQSFYMGSMCTAVPVLNVQKAETPKPPHPRIWAHIRGRYWSAKIDNISL
jgi:hypothetical protein